MRIERTLYETQRLTVVLTSFERLVDGQPEPDKTPDVTITHDGNQTFRLPLADAEELGRLLVALPLLDRLQAEAARVEDVLQNEPDDLALDAAHRFVVALAEGCFPKVAAARPGAS